MNSDNGWYQVSVSYAVFGLFVKDGKIHKAAPIAMWSKGKEANFVFQYYITRKGAYIQKLKEYSG
jgi:hypothetical protein